MSPGSLLCKRPQLSILIETLLEKCLLIGGYPELASLDFMIEALPAQGNPSGNAA